MRVNHPQGRLIGCMGGWSVGDIADNANRIMYCATDCVGGRGGVFPGLDPLENICPHVTITVLFRENRARHCFGYRFAIP